MSVLLHRANGEIKSFFTSSLGCLFKYPSRYQQLSLSLRLFFTAQVKAASARTFARPWPRSEDGTNVSNMSTWVWSLSRKSYSRKAGSDPGMFNVNFFLCGSCFTDSMSKLFDIIFSETKFMLPNLFGGKEAT